jgi:hypothetical protein
LKIIFICSCLEPGHDGVGDYTRRLACELIRQGHVVEAISLNDKYISDQCLEVQDFDSIDLPVLRLSTALPLTQKLNIAKGHIDEFNPDWISLQFVIFGYHPKGLPLWLNKLAALGKGRRWHIMFHELWLGMELNASKKHLLWGKIQKQIVGSLIRKLKPNVTHTHTRLYQHKLLHIGLNSQHLPLFGNIPMLHAEEGLLDKNFKTNKLLKFVIFGHIHPSSPVKYFCAEIAKYAVKNNIQASLTFIGNCGMEQENWVINCQEARIEVQILGQQSADNISKVLREATIGISTTPVALLGKSGSVAAMLEHQLPVICVPCLWEPPNFINLEIPEGIAVYKQGNLEEILNTDLNFGASINIENISKQFIDSLLIDKVEYGQY